MYSTFCQMQNCAIRGCVFPAIELSVYVGWVCRNHFYMTLMERGRFWKHLDVMEVYWREVSKYPVDRTSPIMVDSTRERLSGTNSGYSLEGLSIARGAG